MVLFHLTTAAHADAIPRRGFRDIRGRDLPDDEDLSGVRLTDMPLECTADVNGDTLLEVALAMSEEDLAPYLNSECVEEGRGYSEWLVPAAVLNPRLLQVRFLHEESVYVEDGMTYRKCLVPARANPRHAR